MATYALTFATRAAFDTSLASGDIYNLMQGVTSSKPSVAITATITESGETFACGTNVMVDIKSVGPGDYVMYDSTNNKFFGIASKWIDNNYPAQPTQHIMIFKSGVLPARYVVCGTVIKRFGNRIRLAGTFATLPWTQNSSTDYEWLVSSIPLQTVTLKKSRTETTDINTTDRISYPSTRYQEASYPNGSNTFMPILRSEWNAAVDAGSETITGRNNVTVTLADYNYSFDEFLRYNYAPLWPASYGSYSMDNSMIYTRKIVEDFVANHSKALSDENYAAGYCYNYAVAAPGLGKHHWFLGSVKAMGEARPLCYTFQVAVAWGQYDFWTSVQYSSANAWSLDALGPTNYTSKRNTNTRVVPLADLILEN